MKIKPIIYLTEDRETAEGIKNKLSLFEPKINSFFIPAWDTMPYDSSSPNKEIQSKRINVINNLFKGNLNNENFIIITTVNAILQKIPNKQTYKSKIFKLENKKNLDIEELKVFLTNTGYSRIPTVREQGEYSIRGGIIDIYPSNYKLPIRIDTFGDYIEKIKTFDPLTQISKNSINTLEIYPSSELPLDQDSIKLFKKNYKNLFGLNNKNNIFYQSIINKKIMRGSEQWLPLFFNNMISIFDIISDYMIVMDYMVNDKINQRINEININYDERIYEKNLDTIEEKIYALKPEKLYLNKKIINNYLNQKTSIEFNPFKFSKEAKDTFSFRGYKSKDFISYRINNNKKLFYEIKKYILDNLKKNFTIFLFYNSNESASKILNIIGDKFKIYYLDQIKLDVLYDPMSIIFIKKNIKTGFYIDNNLFLSEQNFFGNTILPKSKSILPKVDKFITETSSFIANDYIVHIDHGIGIYRGLKTINVINAKHDCLMIDYQGGDKLYLPVENIDMISRYSSDESSVSIDKLGNSNFHEKKAKLKKNLKSIADRLIKTAAIRKNLRAPKLSINYDIFQDFNQRFPYELTDDQQKTLNEVINDLSSGIPMDRLLCGDVGFGKTEIAIRASFISVMESKQVAIIVPTTLLARQHYLTFKNRYNGYPIKISSLSRLNNYKKNNLIKSNLENGQIDLIIGTHSLLNDKINFKNLGLVIIDEEQHFGVKHKEKIKNKYPDIHLLTMTATPIPRTLQMSLSGLRDLSLITTPPIERLSVRTYIFPFDRLTVRDAIIREKNRSGKTFFVSPRIKYLPEIEKFLLEYLPEISYLIVHGKMSGNNLEDKMQKFYEGEIDLLISTNIIESGLDIPSANTIIVYKSEKFGLSQLYQLRGRVGRSSNRGYAYLTTSQFVDTKSRAHKRLEVMQTLDHLGASFNLASHDLDIRGGGNLLGEEQSGHVKEVGFELYQEMLKEAVLKAQGNSDVSNKEYKWSPNINLGIPVLIPEKYVEDLDVRISIYKRLGQIEEIDNINKLKNELIDRFGDIPIEVSNLIEVINLKLVCKKLLIEKIEVGNKGLTIKFVNNDFPNPDRLINFIYDNSKKIKLRPDHKLFFDSSFIISKSIIDDVRVILKSLQELLI